MADEMQGDNRYGFYSGEHRRAGAKPSIYVDANGQEVTVTAVSTMPSPKWYTWSDRKDLGKLSKFVRTTRTGPETPPPPEPDRQAG